MSCINCGSPFHEVWNCPRPRIESTAARKDVRPLDVSVPRSRKATATLSGSIPEAAKANDVVSQAGTQAPPVDTNSLRDQKASSGNTDGSDPLKQTEPAALIVGKRRGRPQTITDMKAYKAQKERERRARIKVQK